jgi:menaquinone-9 beta-reductase
MNDFDVAIVGAGPAGSATAIALARRGYAVALVDKQRFPREKLCGDFVSPINWRIFQDLGVDNRVLAQSHTEVTGFRITSYSGAEAKSPFSSNDQQRVIGLGLGRAQLDQLLLERAAELGATVRTGCRIERLSRNTQEWRFETSEHESWRSKILIGADGRNSWVARQLGMNTHGSTQGRSVGFQMRIKCPVTMDRIEIHLFPGGYAGLIGVGDGTINLGLAVDRRNLPREGIKEYLLTEVLVENPHLKTILERRESGVALRSAYPVYFPKRRSFAEAVLLVGDAARVTEPVTGEGIYFAMRSGMLAAEALDQALSKCDFSAEHLRTYQQMCARALRSRVVLNSILRFAIYRPVLIDALIRLSVSNGRILRALVDTICAPEPAR